MGLSKSEIVKLAEECSNCISRDSMQLFLMQIDTDRSKIDDSNNLTFYYANIISYLEPRAKLIDLLQVLIDDNLQFAQKWLDKLTAGEPLFKMIMPHRFDLEKLIADLNIRLMEAQQQYSGFAFYQALMAFLPERLKDDVYLGDMRMENICLGGIYGNIDDSVRQLRSYITSLDRQHTVVFIEIEDNGINNEQMYIQSFWQKVQNLSQKSPTTKRMLIFFTLKYHNCPLPQNIQYLDCCKFEKTDIYRWINTIVRGMQWHTDIISSWFSHMCGNCECEGEIMIDLVYNYLDRMHQLLQQNPQPQSILDMLLQERE